MQMELEHVQRIEKFVDKKYQIRVTENVYLVTDVDKKRPK